MNQDSAGMNQILGTLNNRLVYHYKKRGLWLHFKNTAVDPKNVAIGYSHVSYSRVYKCGLYCATIALASL